MVAKFATTIMAEKSCMSVSSNVFSNERNLSQQNLEQKQFIWQSTDRLQTVAHWQLEHSPNNTKSTGSSFIWYRYNASNGCLWLDIVPNKCTILLILKHIYWSICNSDGSLVLLTWLSGTLSKQKLMQSTQTYYNHAWVDNFDITLHAHIC